MIVSRPVLRLHRTLVHMNETDKDVLRFLWVDDIDKAEPKVITLRFTPVVFGLSSSPFLLNTTSKHYIEQYEQCDPDFNRKFLERIYVDDLTSGDSDVDSTFELYVKSKLRLKEAGFNLRKFITNSGELQTRIEDNERLVLGETGSGAGGNVDKQVVETPVIDTKVVEEEYMTSSRSVLGSAVKDVSGQRILGTLWNYRNDNLVFDCTNTASSAKRVEPTETTVISTASKMYDPLGMISPITIQLKILFQELCTDNKYWEEPLEGSCKSI